MGGSFCVSFWKGLFALCVAVGFISGPRPLFGAHAVGEGYWSTKGRMIVDANDNEVQFSGVTWTGFDSPDNVVHGIWNHSMRPMKDHMIEMKKLGFNLIRISFAGSNLLNAQSMPAPGQVDTLLNPQLENLASLEIVDRIVEYAKLSNMKILLCYHRVKAGDLPEPGLWYNANINATMWISMLTMLAQRYRNESTVIGIAPFNEPHKNPLTHDGPYWKEPGTMPGINWRDAVTQAGDAIHSVNPNLLIFVQGLDNNAWWGGDLTGIRNLPVQLKVPNKVVYEAHDYGPMTAALQPTRTQPWFQHTEFPRNLVELWDFNFGYLLKEDLAPVVLGEWGSLMNESYAAWAKEQLYLGAMGSYIQNNTMSWIWFQWTPNSIDTGGILADDYYTPVQRKVTFLRPLVYPDFKLPLCEGGLGCEFKAPTFDDVPEEGPGPSAGTLANAEPPSPSAGERHSHGGLGLLVAVALSLWQSYLLLLC